MKIEKNIMKTLLILALLAMAVVSMSGCAGNRNAVIKAGESRRQNVFKEVAVSAAVTDKALLKIVFPIKNFKARFIEYYFKHTDPPYTVTINIDGQSVALASEPVLEDLSGDFKENPEVGTGWKYIFKKELILETGKHHITIAVPLSDVVIEKDVTLKAGANLMQLAPVYNTSISGDSNHPRFSNGLRGAVVKMNSKEL